MMSEYFSKTNIRFLVLALSLTMTSSVFAQNETTTQTTTDTTTNSNKPSRSESYLKDIRDILAANVDKLPIYLNQITKMALSWLSPDDSTATANLQNQLANLASAKAQITQTQNEIQTPLLNAFVPPPVSKSPLDMTYYNRNIAGISYQSMLRPPALKPQDQQDQEAAILNYTLNASGLNIQHVMPAIYWNNNPSIPLYKNYYYTASAVQTYNGYILSELYANAKNGNKTKEIQRSLIQQATSSDWFTQIASENIGIVLRQILLYNSQNYVVLSQMLETQQKLLAAQVMNNALLIAVNQEAEGRLYAKASGNMSAL